MFKENLFSEQSNSGSSAASQCCSFPLCVSHAKQLSISFEVDQNQFISETGATAEKITVHVCISQRTVQKNFPFQNFFFGICFLCFLERKKKKCSRLQYVITGVFFKKKLTFLSFPFKKVIKTENHST